MRHRVYGSQLGRNKDERSRLFKALLQVLFTYGTIETSQEKGKAIKGLVDKVINLAKNKNTSRLVKSYINNKDLENRLIKEIVPKLGTRSSGYTSMVRLGTRMGDQTMMVRMSLIGAEELEPIKKESRVPSETKFARGGKSQHALLPSSKAESRKEVKKPIKKEIKVKEKIEKVVKKPTRAVKVSASRKGAKKS